MKKRGTLFLSFALCLLCLAAPALLAGCDKSANLSQYISENRTGYYLAENGEISLKAYYTLREYPYAADGVCGDVAPVAEVFVYAENTGKAVTLSFTENGKTHSGEMNYDSVKQCFSFSESAGGETPAEIVFSLTIEGETVALAAENKKTDASLSETALLQKVSDLKADLIASMTKSGVFAGELYIRFIYDEGGYYYVGIINKQGENLALLLDAESGDLIAEKTL